MRLLQVSLLVQYRFNRYMVECEYINHCYLSLLMQVLIDTWWNVN